jgi:hypothetical protein
MWSAEWLGWVTKGVVPRHTEGILLSHKRLPATRELHVSLWVFEQTSVVGLAADEDIRVEQDIR